MSQPTRRAASPQVAGVLRHLEDGNPATVSRELLACNIVRGRAELVSEIIALCDSTAVSDDTVATLVRNINCGSPRVGLYIVRALVAELMVRGSFRVGLVLTRLLVLGVVHEAVFLETVLWLNNEKHIDAAIAMLSHSLAHLHAKCPQSAEYTIQQFPAERLDQLDQEAVQLVKNDVTTEDEETTEHCFDVDEEFTEDLEEWKAAEEEYEKRPERQQPGQTPSQVPAQGEIIDMTDQARVDLKKTVYLSLMSALSADEATHKLLKLDTASKHAQEVVDTLVETCAHEKIYNKIYGNIGVLLCGSGRRWPACFEAAFRAVYETVHQYETPQIRNLGTLFGHMLSTDALSWHVFDVVAITLDESTPSNRIFLKSLFDELRQDLGLKTLHRRLSNPRLSAAVARVFPSQDLDNVRFAINFFTAIGMGPLTDEMRAVLDKSRQDKKT